MAEVAQIVVVVVCEVVVTCQYLVVEVIVGGCYGSIHSDHQWLYGVWSAFEVSVRLRVTCEQHTSVLRRPKQSSSGWKAQLVSSCNLRLAFHATIDDARIRIPRLDSPL